MRRFVVLSWGSLMTLAVACSDDGLIVQQSDSGGDGGPVTSGAPGSTGGEDGPATSGPEEDGTTGSPPSDSTGEPPPQETTTSGDTGGTGPDTSTGTGTGTDTGTGTGTSTGGCEPITEDPSAVGMKCDDDLDCPMGYTCQEFSGFAFQQTCQIICEDTCECPMGYTCTETIDKTMMPWFQCDP